MADIIDMPKLSDTMSVGTLVTWLKKEGDEVASGDMVAEVETDKATMEVESFTDGVLLKQYAKAGEQLPIGAPLCAIGEKGESAPEVDMPSTDKAAPKEASEEEAEAPSLEKAPATEKATPKDGDATKAEKSYEKKSIQKESDTPDSPQHAEGERIKASPLAKKLAAEKNIPLEAVAGSGPAGRIVKADILKAEKDGVTASSASGSKPRKSGITADAIVPMPGMIAEDSSQPVSGMRSAIARRLVESKQSVPHFYLEVEIDAAPLLSLRKQLNQKLVNLEPEKGGMKVTVNDFILKATTEALRRVPAVNASWQGDHIQQHGNVHLAFGVALEEGLVTPIIRNAQQKSLRQISAEAKSLIVKARDRKLKPDDMTGSTFTVTNLGMYGVKNFYGIINPPNAGILSVSSTRKVPVVAPDGSLTVGERMHIGFSGDHRVVDGALGAQFLQALAEILETPALMLV